MLRLLPGISFLLISTVPVYLPAFSQNLSRVFLVLVVVKPVPAWARKIKISHRAHHYRQLMQIPVLSARGIQIGSKTCVIFSLGLRSKIGDKIWVVVWEKETFFWCNEATSETLMYKLVTQLNNVTQSISLNKFICSSATMPPETDPLYRQVIVQWLILCQFHLTDYFCRNIY